MEVYLYRGTDRSGAAVSGEQTAADKTELMNLLKRRQIKVNKLSEKGKEFNMPTFGGGVNAKDLAVFTRQLSGMIDAGLPLVQCLEILAGQQENKTFQTVLTATRGAVEGGATLSAAMRKHEKVFDALYVNLVEAGETGGILDTILQRLATYIEKNVKLKRAVKSALVYPVAVLLVAGGVITLLLWKVVPIFATLFLGLGVDLPLPTRIVIALSDFVGSIFGLLIVIALGGMVVGLKVWYGTPVGRYTLDSILLKLPLDWHLVAENCRGAVHTNTGHLDLLGRADPRRLGYHRTHGRERGRRESYFELRPRLRWRPESNLADPLKDTNVVPGMVTQMIVVGEQTGSDGRHAAKDCRFL